MLRLLAILPWRLVAGVRAAGSSRFPGTGGAGGYQRRIRRGQAVQGATLPFGMIMGAEYGGGVQLDVSQRGGDTRVANFTTLWPVPDGSSGGRGWWGGMIMAGVFLNHCRRARLLPHANAG